MMDISKTILLTGAGFTHDFGGFLAQEMWSIIFNHPKIQTQPKVREVMLQEEFDFDYESIYEKILHGKSTKYSKQDKEAIRISIPDAYQRLDDAIRQKNTPNAKNIDLVRRLIDRFSGDMETPGFFFTLNQDIFIERYFIPSLNRLGINERTDLSSPHKKNYKLDQEDYITVSDDDAEIKRSLDNPLSRKGFHYIKLHGSLDWKSRNGSDMLVVGWNKETQINSEPLLSRYFDIFKKVLAMRERKLLIIGYGFRDKHINEIIADSIKNYGLKLYVISPEQPREFLEKVKRGGPKKNSIIDGLSGYYPYTLLQVLEKSTFNDQMIIDSFLNKK